MAITPSEYARAAKIKISVGQIDSTQTNLPVVLTHLLTDFPADLLDPASGTPALNGGADLRICTDLAGTNELPIHVLCCVVDATAGLRKFVAFTTIPTALDGTEIYLFWGKAGATAYAATDPYGRNAVYLNWEMVTHDLTEECTGNYPGAFTVGGNPTQVDGPWGNPNGAYLFDGNDYIKLATGGRLPFDGISGNADMHVLGWLDCQSTGNYQRAMQISQLNGGNLQFGANANDTGSFFVCAINTTGVKRPNKVPMTPNTGWHLCQANVEYSIDGAGETDDAELWVDTAFGQGTEGSVSAGAGNNESSINFGRRNNNTQHYTGKGAGFWFHKTARPTDFVTAMGRNQTNQAGWATVVETYNLGGGPTQVETTHSISFNMEAKVETPYNVVMNLGTISQVITDHVIAMNLQQTSTTDYNIIANLTTAVETTYNISTDFIGRTLTQYLMNMNFDGVSSDVWYPATYKQDFARPYELNLDDKLGRVLDCCLVFEDAGTIGSQPTTIESINSGYDHDVAMTYNTTGKLVGDGAMRFTRDAGTKGVLAGADATWAGNAQDKSRIYLCDFKVYNLPPSGSDYVWAAAGFVVVIAANGDVELRYRSQSGAYHADFFTGMATAGKRLRVVGQLNKTADTVISRINGISPSYSGANSVVFDDSGVTGQPRYSETGVGGNGSVGFEGHINACGFGVNFNGEELSIDDITTASQADYPYLTLATVEENVRCLKWGTGLGRQEGLELTGLVGVLTIEIELAEDMPAFFTNTTSYLFDGRRTAGTSASDGSNTWLHTSSTGSGVTNLKINGTASDATGFKSAVAGDVLSFTVTGAGDAVLIGNRYDHFNYAIEGLALSSVRVRDDNGLHVFMLDLSEGDVVTSETSANVANLCNFGSGSGYVTDVNGDIVGFIGGNSRHGTMAEWAADSAFTISGSFKTPAVIPPVAYLFGRGDNYAEYIAFNTSEIIVRIGSNSYNLAAPVANTEYTLTITRDVSNNINIDLNGTPYGPFVNAATARFSMAFGGSTDIDSGEVTLLGNWQFTRTGDDRLYDFTGGDIKRVRDLNGVADMTIVTASEQKWTEVTPKRYSSLGTGRDYATMDALKTALQNDDSEHHVVDWYGTTEDTIAVHFSDQVFDSGITFRAAPGHEASFAAVNGAAATMPYALYTYACPVKFENIKFDVALYGRNIHLDRVVFSSTGILRNAAGNPATHGRGYGLIRNSLVNHVQVDFDAQYVFEDAHIMGTVTHTAGDLALVNTILSSTTSPHTFSAGSLSISNVYMARSETPATESVNDFINGVDMSAWFNNTAGGDWRIKQGIRDSEFIGKGYHTSDMCSAFYMAGEALSQVITDYNMLMNLSQQVTTDHQIVANVLGRIVTNYNLLADLLGRVNTDQQHVFNLLGQVVTNMNYDFSLTQAASTTMAYSFDMMGQVETSQDYRFNLLGSVEAQQNYVLNLLQAAEADMAYRLDMNTQVSTDMNYQLSLRQLVETSYDLVVNYLGRITTDFGVALDLLETKEASYAVDIDLLSQAITDQQIVINALEQRQTTQSINLALLEQAYVDHQQLMDFRQRVQEDYQVLVDLNQRGQSTYQMWMDFLASVEGETDYTILLNFLESVTVDQSAVINLLQRELASQNYDLTFVGRVETDHQAVMNLIGRAEANQTYALDFFQRVEKSFEYRFNLLQSGGAETDYSIILDLRQRLETEFAVDLQLLQRETGDHTIVADLLNTVTMDFVNRLELLGRVETDFTVSLKYLARSETTYDVVFDVDSDILPMRPLHYVVGAQTKIMFSAGPDTLTFYAGDEDDDSTTIKI